MLLSFEIKIQNQEPTPSPVQPTPSPVQPTPAISVTPTWFVTAKDPQLKQQLIEGVFDKLETNSPKTFKRLKQLNPPYPDNVTRETTPIVEVHRQLLNSFHPSVRQKRWVVGIIDASGSMRGQGYSQLTRAFEQLLIPDKAKANFLYSPSDRFSLTVYQGNRAYNIPETIESNDEAVRETLYGILKNKVKPDGGTPIDLGLKEGFKTALNVPDGYQLEVFLFTDGKFRDPIDSQLLQLHQRLQEKNAELTIVGAGNVDSKQLINLANKLDARPIISKNANKTLDELLKAFREAQI